MKVFVILSVAVVIPILIAMILTGWAAQAYDLLEGWWFVANLPPDIT